MLGLRSCGGCGRVSGLWRCRICRVTSSFGWNHSPLRCLACREWRAAPSSRGTRGAGLGLAGTGAGHTRQSEHQHRPRAFEAGPSWTDTRQSPQASTPSSTPNGPDGRHSANERTRCDLGRARQGSARESMPVGGALGPTCGRHPVVRLRWTGACAPGEVLHEGVDARGGTSAVALALALSGCSVGDGGSQPPSGWGGAPDGGARAHRGGRRRARVPDRMGLGLPCGRRCWRGVGGRSVVADPDRPDRRYCSRTRPRG